MIAIVDIKGGNTGSLRNAFSRIGLESTVTSHPDQILSADAVVLPGQGRAGSAMTQLESAGLCEVIVQLSRPVLGICLGMQLFGTSSEEDNSRGLGIIDGRCRKFPTGLRTPQIGWNQVRFTRPSPLVTQFDSSGYYYFANSYYFDADSSHTDAVTSYGFQFPSAVSRENFFGVQFHPEKSGQIGEQVLRNFCEVSKLL